MSPGSKRWVRFSSERCGFLLVTKDEYVSHRDEREGAGSTLLKRFRCNSERCRRGDFFLRFMENRARQGAVPADRVQRQMHERMYPDPGENSPGPAERRTEDALGLRPCKPALLNLYGASLGYPVSEALKMGWV